MNKATQTTGATGTRSGRTPLSGQRAQMRLAAWLLAATAGLGMAWQVQAQTAVVTKGVVAATSMAPATGISTDFATVGPALDLIIGKSMIIRLPAPIDRISMGNPLIADVQLISPIELYLLGKTYGSTNLLIWRKGVVVPTQHDVNVSIDTKRMEAKLRELLPNEKGIHVFTAADSVILTGEVSSAVKAKHAVDIADAFIREINKSMLLSLATDNIRSNTKSTEGITIAQSQSRVGSTQNGSPPTGGTNIQINSGGGGGTIAAGAAAAGALVINQLRVAQAQQVMLEVKVAEVSKSLLDKLGASFNLSSGSGTTYGILSNLLSGGAGKFTITAANGNIFSIDAEKKDGLIKILAEPNIVSISGQEASFLAGGRIFIPVSRTNNLTGGSTITLEEKEFGVGLKFTPTVLEGGRIHLQVAPEVSELSQTGSPFTTVGGDTAILPSITTRKVQTTVQLMDGQSLAIAGLIKNNVTESVKRIPLFGEIPILGALFRSSEFQNDRSELMFLITPRLVKPLDGNYILPTDSFTPPSRQEFFLGDKLEGTGHGEVPQDKRGSPGPQSGGFEVK